MFDNTRPKRHKNPDYAATRADYAPSLAYQAMISGSAPRAAKDISGDGRVCHPWLLRLLVSTASTTIPWYHINSIDFIVQSPSRCNNHGWQKPKSKQTV